jgi:hypothetical protein
MRYLIALLFLCVSKLALAETPVVIMHERFSVNLYQESCRIAQVLVYIPINAQSSFKYGEGVYDGKPFKLCWTDNLPGISKIVIVWEDASVQFLPLNSRGTLI